MLLPLALIMTLLHRKHKRFKFELTPPNVPFCRYAVRRHMHVLQKTTMRTACAVLMLIKPPQSLNATALADDENRPDAPGSFKMPTGKW